jgi:RES domain-containing protein
MRPYPDFPELLQATIRLAPRAISFNGTLYRACTPQYANSRDLLTGAGAFKFGGRWNTPNTFHMVYLSLHLEAAIAETLGLAGHYGFDPATRLPMTFVAVDATLDKVLDLTNASIRKSLGVTIAQLTNCPWKNDNAAGNEALTQAIGRAAFHAGLQAILVPSAVKRTTQNLNIFPNPRGPAGRLRVRRADQLPPPPPTTR